MPPKIQLWQMMIGGSKKLRRMFDIENLRIKIFRSYGFRLTKRISTDGIGSSSQVKKNKTKSTAASMKEDVHSLVELMSNKSTASSHAVDDPTIDKCMDFLTSIPDIFERGEMYNYFVNMFLKKDIRQVFLKMPTDEARKSWVEYNYQLYLKKV